MKMKMKFKGSNVAGGESRVAKMQKAEMAPTHPPLAHPNQASGMGRMSAYAGGFKKRKKALE